MAKNLDFSILLDFYGEMLTEKQREAVYLYYNEDLSLAEIAENQGISRQGVRDNIKRGEGLLTEMEERLKLVEKFRQFYDKIEHAQILVKCIEDENARGCFSSNIAKNAKAVLEILGQLNL